MYEEKTDQPLKALRKGDLESHDETPLDPDDMAIPTESQVASESWSRTLS